VGQADHSSKVVLPIMVYLSVIKDTHREGLDPLGLSSHEKRENEKKKCIPDWGLGSAIMFHHHNRTLRSLRKAKVGYVART